MCVDAIALYQTLIDPNESSFYDKVGVAPIPEGPAGRQSYKQVVWGASIIQAQRTRKLHGNSSNMRQAKILPRHHSKGNAYLQGLCMGR